jgi:FlaA1/EpsC-like NDP-sugar epimerase
VVVYGCEHHGTIFKKALLGEMGLKYRVVAFVDNDERFTGKSIDGIPIYPLKNLPQLLQELQVQMMFFANPDLDGRIKNQVVDVCLSRKVRVMNIPPLKQWLHGHLEASQMQEVKIEELLGRPSIKLNNEQHLDNMISGKRILITGAAGSIGSEMARQLVAIQPEMLVLCDQSETGLHDLYYELETKYNFGRHSQIFLCDIKDRRSVEQMYRLHRPEIVFHAAAYKHVPVMENHPSEAIRNNVLGTKVCADLAIEYGVERFLLVSTDKAINPTNIMGASKRIAEIYCNIVQDLFSAQQQKVVNMPGSKTKFITTRFGNVLASNGSVIPRFHEQIQNGGPVTVTHPDIIRYFMTIQEACSLVLEAVTMGKGGEIFMFDMGEPVRIYDLATKMIRLAGHEPGEDIKIQFTGLRPGEKLYEELLNKKEEVIPTHHAKILIATKAKLDDSMMANKIIELLAAADLCNDSMVVKIMKEMVPEYISNNPVYALFHEVSDISDEKKLTALN